MSVESAQLTLSMTQINDIYKELQQKLEHINVPAAPEERKQEIMNLLHEFNDVKDAAQIVIGNLANMQGKTIKEMHLSYNLPLNE